MRNITDNEGTVVTKGNEPAGLLLIIIGWFLLAWMTVLVCQKPHTTKAPGKEAVEVAVEKEKTKQLQYQATIEQSLTDSQH